MFTTFTRASCLLLSVCVVSAAVQIDSRALRTTQSEAFAQEDLWTLIQADAYLAKYSNKRGTSTPGLNVIGDPIFGTPRGIYSVYDYGDSIIVRCGDRLYHWNDTGCPLRPSTVLPMSPDGFDRSTNGSCFGLFDFTAAYKNEVRIPGLYTFTVCDLNGNTYWKNSISTYPYESSNGFCVATDGSAVALDTIGYKIQDLDRDRRILIAGKASVETLNGWSYPLAVGNKASWLIGTNPDNQLSLRMNAKIEPLIAAACGPQLTAILNAQHELQIFSDTNTRTSIPLAVQPGDNPALMTIGSWLIMATGRNSKTKGGVDLIGNPIGGGVACPSTLLCWRWKDLDAGNTEMAAQYLGYLSPAKGFPDAIYHWQGTDMEIIHFTTDIPTIEHLGKAPITIDWMEYTINNTKVTLEDGSIVLLDARQQPCFVGNFEDLHLQHPHYAVDYKSTGERLVYGFHPEEAKRTTVTLSLEPGSWDVQIDASGNWCVAVNVNASTWKTFSLPAGNVWDKGDDKRATPTPAVFNETQGRFSFSGARVFNKADADTMPQSDWMYVSDAWRIGRTIVIITYGGNIYLTGRKANELILLGRCPEARQFVMLRDTIYLANDDLTICGTIVAGPKLDLEPAAKGNIGNPMDKGPWRAQGNEFVPPRSGTLLWNQHTGLQLTRLRNPDNEVLLLPQGCVVIAADAQGAKLLGKGR